MSFIVIPLNAMRNVRIELVTRHDIGIAVRRSTGCVNLS
jgi:hypothetical protein